MSKILLANAYEAWYEAIDTCQLIKDGVSTLGYKKRFVSALHNSVELFLKQIMLNRCDYRVASVKDCSETGEPLKTYFASSDLNNYFANLSTEERNKYFSIEFSKLIDIFGDEIKHKGDLQKLNSLRNNETHFYIHSQDYLSESDFVILYNFMVDFSRYIEKECLMPWAFYARQGVDATKLLFHVEDKDKLVNFKYSSAIKRSKVSKNISKILFENDVILCREYSTDDVSEFASEIWNYMEGEECSFAELCAYLASLLSVGAIRYEILEEEIPEELGGGKQFAGARARIKTIE